MNRTALPPGAQALEALEALEAQRRLLCAALAAAVKEMIPGAVLGSCGTTGSGFYHDFLLATPPGADRLAEVEERMHLLLAGSSVKISRLSALEALRFAEGEPLLQEELERGAFADETLVLIGGCALLMREPPARALAAGVVYRLVDASRARPQADRSRPVLTRISGVAFAAAGDTEAHARGAA